MSNVISMQDYRLRKALAATQKRTQASLDKSKYTHFTLAGLYFKSHSVKWVIPKEPFDVQPIDPISTNVLPIIHPDYNLEDE